MSENNNMVLSMLIDSINPEVNGYAKDRFQAITKLSALDYTSEELVKALVNTLTNDPIKEVRDAAKKALSKHQQLLTIQTQLESNEENEENESIVLTTMANTISDERIEREELKLLISQNTLLRDIHKELVALRTSRPTNLQSVRIDDINMDIGSMVVFMLKWMVASIPVAIIVGFIYFIIAILFISRY